MFKLIVWDDSFLNRLNTLGRIVRMQYAKSLSAMYFSLQDLLAPCGGICFRLPFELSTIWQQPSIISCRDVFNYLALRSALS